jgi:hypothetical protein
MRSAANGTAFTDELSERNTKFILCNSFFWQHFLVESSHLASDLAIQLETSSSASVHIRRRAKNLELANGSYSPMFPELGRKSQMAQILCFRIDVSNCSMDAVSATATYRKPFDMASKGSFERMVGPTGRFSNFPGSRDTLRLHTRAWLPSVHPLLQEGSIGESSQRKIRS